MSSPPSPVPRHQRRILVSGRHLTSRPVRPALSRSCRRWQGEYLGGVYVSVAGVDMVRRLLRDGLAAQSVTYFNPGDVAGLPELCALISRLVSGERAASLTAASLLAVGATDVVGFDADVVRSCGEVARRLNDLAGRVELPVPGQVGDLPAVADAGLPDWSPGPPGLAGPLLTDGCRKVSRACEQLLDLLDGICLTLPL